MLVFYRKGDETGYFPSMFLHKAGKREIYEAERLNLQEQKPPPRRFVSVYTTCYINVQLPLKIIEKK